jgi:hypothetical protein
MDAMPIQTLIHDNIGQLAALKKHCDATTKGTLHQLAEIALFAVAVIGAYTTLFTLRLIKKLA